MENKETAYFQLGFLASRISMVLNAYKAGKNLTYQDLKILNEGKGFLDNAIKSSKFLSEEREKTPDSLDLKKYKILLDAVQYSFPSVIEVGELIKKFYSWRKTLYMISNSARHEKQDVTDILTFFGEIFTYCLTMLDRDMQL